jgi:hypothetical protein
VRLTVEYRLAEDGLSVRTDAENMGGRPCPFGAGHHPYVPAPSGRVDDLVLEGDRVGEKQLDETRNEPGGWRVEVGEVTVWADGPGPGSRSSPATCPTSAAAAWPSSR